MRARLDSRLLLPAVSAGNADSSPLRDQQASAAAAAARHLQLQQQLQLQQPGVTAMHLQLSDANLTQLAAHIPHVVKLSGAELQLTAGPQGVGRAAGVSTGG